MRLLSTIIFLLASCCTLTAPVQGQQTEIVSDKTPCMQEWKNVTEEIFYVEGNYTAYDSAFLEALGKVTIIKRKPGDRGMEDDEDTADNFCHLDGIYQAYLRELQEREKIQAENDPRLGLQHISYLPNSSKAEYHNGTLKITAPLKYLQGFDAQLRNNGNRVAEFIDGFDFSGAAPRKDADLYLFIYLSREGLASLSPKNKRTAESAKQTRAQVSKLITKAQNSKGMETVVTVEPGMSKTDISKALKLLKIRNNSYGTPRKRSGQTKQALAEEDETDEEDSDFGSSGYSPSPDELAAFYLPTGTQFETFFIPEPEEEDSDFHVEYIGHPDLARLIKFIDVYLKRIARDKKKYNITTGPTHLDGSPLASPDTPAPEPKPLPADKKTKKKSTTRGFEKL